MPTYEYQCSICKKSYDLRQGFDAATRHPCEECGKGMAKRVLHAPRVLFKGSGFYVTDSKSGSKSAATAEATPSNESAATETKPAATESKPSPASEGPSSPRSASPLAESAASTA